MRSTNAADSEGGEFARTGPMTSWEVSAVPLSGTGAQGRNRQMAALDTTPASVECFLGGQGF